MVCLSERKGYLLRIEPRVFDALRRWADDELRSVNAQIDFLLRAALRSAGRLPKEREDTERRDDADRRKGPKPSGRPRIGDR